MFTLLPDPSRQDTSKNTCKTEEAIARAVNISTKIFTYKKKSAQQATLFKGAKL